MNRKNRGKWLKNVIKTSVLVGTTVLWSCASSLVMQTDANIPRPSVKSWPLNVAVLCDTQTCSHVYNENTTDRPNWQVTTGPSQTQFLKQTLASLFLSTTLIDSLDDVTANYDLVITPTLQDMHFSLPSETQLKHYEAWLKYNVSVTTADGEVVATIPLSGYGKAEDDFFKNNQQGLQLATNLAFRDLGAKLILGIKQHPKIRARLKPATGESGG